MHVHTHLHTYIQIYNIIHQLPMINTLNVIYTTLGKMKIHKTTVN